MSNQVIVITGCQRSGTTLLNLVLDSHPDIVGVDEDRFRPEALSVYLEDPAYGPWVCFKMPAQAHFVEAIAGLPGVRVLWPVRDPRDVVVSMMRLEVVAGGVKAPMAAHPTAGARGQVPACLQALGRVPDDIVDEVTAFMAQAGTGPNELSLRQKTRAAALHWRIKQDLLSLYERAGIPVHVFRYEDLVTRPREEIQKIIDFLGIRWHDDLLAHHRLHSGVSIGRTNNTRAIDQASVGRYRGELGDEEIALIRRIAGPYAARYGYDLGGRGESDPSQ